jgi:hypothetical protein
VCRFARIRRPLVLVPAVVDPPQIGGGTVLRGAERIEVEGVTLSIANMLPLWSTEEKIVLEIELANRGPHRVAFIRTAIYSDYDVHVYRDGGPELPVTATTQDRRRIFSRVQDVVFKRLLPGETYRTRLVLSDWYDLRRPGTYRVWVERRVGLLDEDVSGAVRSEDVEFEVVDGVGLE